MTRLSIMALPEVSERAQRRHRIGHRGGRRRVRQRQPAPLRRPPPGEQQGRLGEVGDGDLRREVRRHPAEGLLVVAANDEARPETGGPPGALDRRILRRRDRDEPGHAARGVPPRLPGQPGVDDEADAGDGERGFRDRRRDDDPPGRCRIRTTGRDAVLLPGGDLPVQFEHLDSVRPELRPHPRRDLAHLVRSGHEDEGVRARELGVRASRAVSAGSFPSHGLGASAPPGLSDRLHGDLGDVVEEVAGHPAGVEARARRRRPPHAHRVQRAGRGHDGRRLRTPEERREAIRVERRRHRDEPEIPA